MSSVQPALVSRLNTGVITELMHRGQWVVRGIVEDRIYNAALDRVRMVVFGSVDEDASVLVPRVFHSGALDAVREVLARPT